MNAIVNRLVLSVFNQKQIVYFEIHIFASKNIIKKTLIMASEFAEGMYDSIFFLGRSAPLPTNYPENKNPVTVDVLEVGWIVAFFTAFCSFLFLLPAMLPKEKVVFVIRLTVTLAIGLIVMLCNFGQEWEVGRVHSHMYYKAGSHEEIDAVIGLKIGLRSANITLNAVTPPKGDLEGEKINYNERFSWAWTQGRIGFGPFAGRVQREFREAQLKGIPYPILWVAEYFTFDGEGFRFGRHYRHAGWYSHICIWTAFPVWILTVILFKLVISYGAVMLSVLGSLMLTAALIWCSIRNSNELAIIFNDKASGILKTHYGIHWYLALIVGILCLVTGLIIFAADYWFHDNLCRLFGVNPYGILDENYDDDVDVEKKVDAQSGIEMQERETLKRSKSKVRFRAKGTRKFEKESHVLEDEYSDLDYQKLSPYAVQNYGYLGQQSIPEVNQQFTADQNYPPSTSGAYLGTDEQQNSYEYSDTAMPYQGPPRPPKPPFLH